MSTSRKTEEHGTRWLMAALFTYVVIATDARAQFAGGSGTAEDPWLVATATQLDAVRTNLTAHFKQTADIDLGVAPWNEASGWVPIGTSTAGQRFTGAYDGGGHLVSNLFINRPATPYQGLFGYLEGAVVKNLRLEGVSVRGTQATGALTGYAAASAVDNIRVTGWVKGGDDTGGLAGFVTGGTLHRIAVDTDVEGGTRVGGLVGYVTGAATVYHCSTLGSVQGSSNVGGLIGYLWLGNPLVSDCYSRSAVSGATLGGLVGYIRDSRIHRCYSTGAVSGTSYAGGLLGRYYSGTVQDSYWDTESSGQSGSAAGIGRTTAEMLQRANYAGYNFHTLWLITEGTDCPLLRDLSGHTPRQTADLAELDGAGTPESPYIVTTSAQLDAMRQNLSAHYRMTNDIDLAATVVWDGGRGWTAVGTNAAPFTGSFDGGGFAIRNLTLSRPELTHQGLFGMLSGATVRNLRLLAASVQGAQYCGTVAGRADNSSVEGVRATGTILGTSSETGGVLGYVAGGALHRVTADVTVKGGNQSGGLAGYVTGAATVYHCSTLGAVQGSGNIGGLIGYLWDGNPVVSDCFSRAAASGATVGGLVGYMRNSRIHRSYSSGAVSGSSFAGGLLGRYSSGTVQDCYWDTESSGLTGSASGTGRTTAEMFQRANYAGYNFDTLWLIDEGAEYPLLRDLSAYAPRQTPALATLAGSGTAGDPYIVTTAAELDAVRQGLAAHYRMANDIDLAATVVWDGGRGWTAVGTAATPFAGSFDGGGYTLRNLTLNRPESTHQGLFGSLNNAAVRNLRLAQACVHGSDNTGLLTGYAIGTSLVIEQIHVSGVLRGGSNSGGIAGNLDSGKLHAVSSDTEVLGANNVGGIAGYTHTSGVNIQRAASRGSVQGGSFVGGLIGYTRFATLADCYSRASVGGTDNVGGAVGYNGLYAGNLYRVYSSGAVTGTGSYLGGLIGRQNIGAVADSYWDTESSGRATSGAGTGLPSATLLQRITYTNWNFFSLWRIDQGCDYPVFQNSGLAAAPAAVALIDLPGDGTLENPYIVTTPDELNAMRLSLAAHYRIANDIDLAATALWNAGGGWEPVGTLAAPFTGSLDGGGFTLRHLTVNRPTVAYQGLFGSLSGATVRDLRLQNVSVRGADYTGALAGHATGVALLVEHLQVSGEISGATHTGGIVGYLNQGSLFAVAIEATVRGGDHTGGITGYTYAGEAKIQRACVRGAVLGATHVGGLVGYIRYGTLVDCYNRAGVTGVSNVGGAVGFNGYYAGNIYRVYSSGAVAGSGSYVGGLIGRQNAGTVSDSYWDTQTAGLTYSGAGTGLTTETMQRQATYTNWDFYRLWRIDQGSDYPVFQTAAAPAAPATVALASLEGTGAPGDPYIVTTADELNAMRLNLAAHYRMTNDIDLAAAAFWNGGSGWEPVGTSATPFTGSLDGGGFTLRNLTVNRPTVAYQGLFGALSGATVRDLRLERVSVRGADFTGALAGHATGTTMLVERLRVAGEISGATHTGGIVGYLNQGTLSAVSSVSTVRGGDNTGGITGYTNSSDAYVRRASVLGDVQGATSVGGLVGYVRSGNIIDSCNRATVQGTAQVGGALGYHGYYYSELTRVYSMGPVAGAGTYIGGLVGRLNAGAVALSYWDTETSGQAASSGGTGRTTAQMHQEATFATWNFIDIWVIEEDLSYPYLRDTGFELVLIPDQRWHDNTVATGQVVEVVANTAWAAVADEAWITVTNSAGGRDNGVFTYAVAANPSPTARTGTITVSNGIDVVRSFTVYQGAELSITPADERHDASASAGHSVAVAGNVAWTAQTTNTWIFVTDGASGSGAGTVVYRIEAHSATNARNGTITIAGGGIERIFTVSQEAAPPRLELDPAERLHTASASIGSTITVAAVGVWTAVADHDWITVTGGASGDGDGAVTYSVASCTNAIPRQGSITLSDGVNTVAFRVAQAGGADIALLANPPAGGVLSGGGGHVPGTTATVIATPSAGYSFYRWTENGVVVSTDAEYSFTVDGDRTLTANFCVGEEDYTIAVTADPEAGGVLTGGGVYRQCSHVTLTATPNPGYSFYRWTEDGEVVTTDAEFSFTAARDRDLTAHFCVGEAYYTNTVTAVPEAGGTVAGGGVFRQCSSVTVTAVLDPLYDFMGWSEGGDTVSTNLIYTFTATTNRNLIANFRHHFDSGFGTAEDPFRVALPRHLNRVREYLGARFIQIADIALDASPWSDGEGWMPLGTLAQPFTGFYDGDGFVVQGLAINRPAADYQGLFGYASGAGIVNLGVTNFTITARERSGGLAGQIVSGSVVSNAWSTGTITAASRVGGLVGSAETANLIAFCFSTAAVTGSSERVGGLVGQSWSSGVIRDSSATGPVRGTARVGGLVGNNETSSRIERGFATGSVSGTSRVGGLVGNNETSSTIESGFATGRVNGTTQVGGLVGYNGASSRIEQSFALGSVIASGSIAGGLAGDHRTSVIEDSYASGAVSGVGDLGGLVGTMSGGSVTRAYSCGLVSGSGGNLGGLIGRAETGAVATESYWDTETSGRRTSAAEPGAAERFTGEMIVQANYPNWDFETMWSIGHEGAHTYPYLQMFGTGHVQTVAFFAPYARNVRVTGVDRVGETLTGHYVYHPGSDELAESGTTVQWRRAAVQAGPFVAIADATNMTYTLTGDDDNRWFQFEVTVRDTDNTAGAPREALSWFTEGTGDAVDPWQIATAMQLSRLASWVGTANAGRHFRLIADIELGVAPWNAGAGWMPAGTSASPFAGTLDGAGFAIRNLTVNRSGTTYQGLFGSLSGATVRNLRLENASVSGSDYTGSLTGYTLNSLIEKVHATGKVTGGAWNTGGLIGVQNGGSLSHVSFAGSVQGGSQTGGLVGLTSNSATIRYAFTLGAVRGANDVGGLVGHHGDGYPEIADCYSRASVSGSSNVGGLIGYMYYSRAYRGYSSGTVTGTSYAGGFLGRASTVVTVADCYWDTETSGQAASAGGTGQSTAEMRQQTTYLNFNFFTVWRIDEGVDYPRFRDLGAHAAPAAVTLGDLAGEGTPATPYLITNADELNAMRLDLAAHYRLANDIDLSASLSWDAGRGWMPVGSSTAGQRFTGSLDGAGFAIRGMTVNRPTAAYQGLFGYLDGATLRDLRLESASVRGSDYTGSLTGYALNSLIEKVHATGEVTGGAWNTGGLIGVQNGGSLSHVSFAGSVQGGSQTGGLVGLTSNSATIRYAFTLGAVRGANDVGGLVGHHGDGYPEIADCYSRSSISGSTSVGGLVGYIYYSRAYRSYSSGAVAGASHVGGFLGYSSTAATVADCYWDTETSGQAASAGGTGRSTAEMRQQTTYLNFNFFTVWRIDEGVDYPRFRDLGAHAAPAAVTLDQLDGDGSPATPYLITNADELNAMRLDLAAHYRLANDIDLSASVSWDAGRGWVPVGASGSGQRFTGSLDGAGFAIRGMTVNRPTAVYQGLFGYLDGATLRDLRLESASVRGSDYTGSLTGYALNSQIESVHATGEVTGGAWNTGGLIGVQNGGSLSHVSFAGSVQGGSQTGGLVGHTANGATIRYAYSLGSVQGANDVGGLVGYHYDNYPEIADCYSRSSVSGSSDVGGLVGYMAYSRVYRSYSSGAVAGVSRVGGFLGYASTAATVADCYWDTETSGQAASAGGTGRSTAEMRQQTTYLNFNFFTVWRIDEGVDYPRFRDLGAHAAHAAVTLDQLDGDGSPAMPYLITNSDELNAIRLDLAAHYRLANDIDLSASVSWDTGRGWVPVGASGSGQRFTGSLDGAGFAIRGMTVNRPTAVYQGLFGYLDGATLRDLRLESASVRGSDYTGSLTGYALNSQIESVHATGEVTGGAWNTGGLIGVQNGGSLSHVSFAGSVQGGSQTGGLVGHTSSSVTIRYAFTLGAVRGANDVGGLVGYHYDNYPEIADCYSRSSVSGSSDVGGLVGYMAYSRVYRSYSSGAVSGTSNVGGFLGYASTASTVADCYWDIGTSGRESSAGGTGRTTVQMKQQATFSTWNFTTIWDIEEDVSYPFHRETAPDIALSPADRYHRNGASTGHVFAVVANVAWTATTDVAWITLTHGASGRDNGTATYSLASNAVPTLRSGTITVSNSTDAERSFTVYQGAELTIASADAHHDASASTGHAIAVDGNVDWTATSAAEWLVVTGGTNGTDAGTVIYRVTENLSLDARGSAITISGGGIDRLFTVTQTGAAPYLSIDPEFREFAAAGATNQSLAVTANTAWTAVSEDDWITVTDGAAGSGDGTVTYSVAATDDHASRLGHITVSNATRIVRHRVHQVSATTVLLEVLSANPERGGVSGSAWCHIGQQVQVQAYPAAGHYVEAWRDENGTVLTRRAGYSFTVESDRILTAAFGTWRQGEIEVAAGPALNTARMSHNAITLPDGRAALFGGHGSGFVALSSAEFWAPGDAAFALAAMQNVHDWPAFALLHDGRYLLAGGAKNSGVPGWAMSELFTPATTNFTAVSNMVRHRAAAGAATLTNGCVLVASGWLTNNDANRYGELFDPDTGSFTAVGPFAVQRSLAIVLSAADGTGVVLGGATPTGTRIDHPVEQYDPATGQITTLRDSLFADDPGWYADNGWTRPGFLQQLEDGRTLWLASKVTGSVDRYRLFTFDPATKAIDQFETVPELPDDATAVPLGHPVIDLPRGRAHWLAQVGGGGTSPEVALYSVDLTSGALMRSSNSVTFAYSLSGAGVNLLADGRLLVTGGSSDGSNNNPVSHTRLITLSEMFAIYTLRYQASVGGTVSGETVQRVPHGEDGIEVAALPGAGAVFQRWSDGNTDMARTDTDVQSNVTVTARFRSLGGAELDWYAARGLAPGEGEDWADVDARAVPGKGTTLLHENIADTDPSDPSDTFRILAISNGPPLTVTFTPGSTARAYTLLYAETLGGAWTNVPGQGPRPGAGGADAMTDDSERPARFYRVKVEMP